MPCLEDLRLMAYLHGGFPLVDEPYAAVQVGHEPQVFKAGHGHHRAGRAAAAAAFAG